jgi:Tfp pilus assembly protein PilE
VNFSPLTNLKGFSLIEPVIIIVVLGILAAVTIPKYQDITGEMKEASCRAALGGLRSGITIFCANQIVTTGTATWPNLTQLSEIGTAKSRAIPRNPYQSNTDSSAMIIIGISRGTLTGTAHGWAYDTATGDIWANTNTVGEKDW